MGKEEAELAAMDRGIDKLLQSTGKSKYMSQNLLGSLDRRLDAFRMEGPRLLEALRHARRAVADLDMAPYQRILGLVKQQQQQQKDLDMRDEFEAAQLASREEAGLYRKKDASQVEWKDHMGDVWQATQSAYQMMEIGEELKRLTEREGGWDTWDTQEGANTGVK